MEAEDAHIAGLVGGRNPQQHLESATHLTLLRNLCGHGTQTAVSRPDDKRENYDLAGFEIDQQRLTWVSSRRALVGVHDRFHELRLTREKHTLANSAGSYSDPCPSWRNDASFRRPRSRRKPVDSPTSRDVHLARWTV
jgi:hypothetical protein